MPEMIRKHCNECGQTCLHNALGKAKEGNTQDYRCTGCGFPLGTGPKKDRMVMAHAKLVTRARLLKG